MKRCRSDWVRKSKMGLREVLMRADKIANNEPRTLLNQDTPRVLTCLGLKTTKGRDVRL